jgi:hypothetical protein
MRSSWNETRMLLRGPLTDKQIEKYEKKGWYSPEFKEARRELMAQKTSRHNERNARRDGNFLLFKDGSKIYSPQ